MRFKLLKQTDQIETNPITHYTCLDCEWSGESSECDFDTEYDEFKGIDREYPICPKCGGGLEC